MILIYTQRGNKLLPEKLFSMRQVGKKKTLPTLHKSLNYVRCFRFYSKNGNIEPCAVQKNLTYTWALSDILAARGTKE